MKPQFDYISKLSRFLSYVSTRHENRKPHMTTYDSQHTILHLKGDWLIEAGLGTGTFVTLKVTKGCLVLITDNNEEQQLREQLVQVQQTVNGIKAGCLVSLSINSIICRKHYPGKLFLKKTKYLFIFFPVNYATYHYLQ